MGIEAVHGWKELSEALKTLPGKVAKGAVRRATAAAAKHIRDAVKGRTPVYSGSPRKGRNAGTIKRAVNMKSASELNTPTQVGYVVTILKGKKFQRKGKRGGRDAYYAGWVEGGHKVVARGKSSKSVGRTGISARRRSSGVQNKQVTAQPFMKPAFEASWRGAIRAFENKARDDFASGRYDK